MTLEDSNGKIVKAGSETDVTEMVGRIGRGIDHCILSDEVFFIQAAGSTAEMVVQYGDGNGHYEADGVQAAETVKALFSSFYRKDDAWKTMVSFVPVDEVGPAGEVNAESPGGAQGRQDKSLKDTLLDSVKHEVKNNVSRMVRRGVRDVFRKFR